ncbi:MAG: hypothetical protein KKC99_00410, partial [Proteobacteria bacterium]|nr:hypothetical protein [Pseudomonadota bacterium]
MSERRKYARVPTRLTGYARITSTLETEPRFSVANINSSPTASLESSKLPSAVISFLTNLDQKIDQLLAHQSLNRIEKNYPIKLDVLEVSGSGLRFAPCESAPVGTLLEVVLLLSHAPMRLAAGKGVVQAGEPGENSFRFEFSRIRN